MLAGLMWYIIKCKTWLSFECKSTVIRLTDPLPPVLTPFTTPLRSFCYHGIVINDSRALVSLTAIGKYLAKTPPHCEATFVLGVGRLTIRIYCGEALGTLTPYNPVTKSTMA